MGLAAQSDVAGWRLVQGKVACLESVVRLGGAAHMVSGRGECGAFLVRQLS